MAGHNVMRNRMTAGRAIISALVLWLAFSGVAVDATIDEDSIEVWGRAMLEDADWNNY